MQKTLQEISNTGVNKNSVIEEGNLCTSSISHILAKRVEAVWEKIGKFVHKFRLPYFSKKGGGKSGKKSGNSCTSSISDILAKRVEASLGKNWEIHAQVPSPIF